MCGACAGLGFCGRGYVWVGWAWQGPHDLVLEVVDDQREVDVHYLAATGHQQLQREDVALTLQELPYQVLAVRWEPTRMQRGQSA